jgi:ankyrin repeat protein
MIRLLLSDPRVDVNPIDATGEQPIHWAAGCGRLEALMALVADPRIDLWAKTLHGKDVLDLALY